MNFGRRSFLGASLPRSQQAIILLLGLGLAGLWIGQTDLIRLPSPSSLPQQHYYIEIGGHIPCPGWQCFLSVPTLQEVWEAAGGRGILPESSQLLSSGSKINVSSDQAVTLERMAGPELLTLGLAIDPNQASAADLEAIPGIGPVTAKRIIEFREAQGPFQNLEALSAVKGLGPGKLNKIKSYLAVSGIGGGSEVGENN